MLWSKAKARTGTALVVGLALVGAGMSKDLGSGWEEKKNDEGKVVQQLKIQAPSMTEEDQYGYNMPDQYKCDACKGVMFHLDKVIKAKHPKSRRLKQWEYTDLFDDACKTSFEGYGVKLHNGENVLSGPGIQREEEIEPGAGAIQMGGETWNKRMSEICRKIVYDQIGEEELYEKFREEGALSQTLCTTETRACTTGPKPPKKESASTKEKETKPKAKKEKAKDNAKDKAKEKPKPKQPPDSPSPSPPQTKAASATGGSTTEGKVDVQTFLRTLAVRHDLTSDEYLTARTPREWEKLTVALAGRIFNRLADSEPDESCRTEV